MENANLERTANTPFLIGAAILVSFFPCGILYPLQYPVREVVTLLLWICAFPTRIGCLSVLILPLLRSDAYGYFAFNLFCIAGTLAVGVRAAEWVKMSQLTSTRLHRLARGCMLISLALAVSQGIDGEAWLRTFPAMYAMGDGRGGGLRTEPSMLAPMLALYLSLVFWHRAQDKTESNRRGKFLFEAGIISLITLLLTRSLSVAIVLACFLPAFASKFRIILTTSAAGVLAAAFVFWDRIRDVLSDSGTFAYLITTALNSWRNVPDIVILANLQAYLLPGNPADMRDKMNLLITSWNPAFLWLDSTYSAFSASASTIGILATTVLFATGIVIGMRRVSPIAHQRAAWILLYITDWFILPKYEPCGWIALGIMSSASVLIAEEDVPKVLSANPIVEV